MSIKTLYTQEQDATKAARIIKKDADNLEAKIVIYFASSSYDHDALAVEMKELFSGAQVFGCSTSGEIVTGKMLKNSLVAMLIDAEEVEDINIQVVQNISTENNVDTAFKKFEDYTNTPMKKLDFEKYVGIILIDGLRMAEEKIMDRIGDLTNVSFIGGSAGDDLKFEKTWVHANGKAYTDAAILALMKPKKGFDIVKTQSFNVLENHLTATKVDEEHRTVIEFNNKPAAEAYAEAIGKPVADAGNYFMHHPVGLVVGDEPYVRSPQQLKDRSMVFYCSILEGMDVSVLESTNIVNDTKKALDKKIAEIGKPAGILNFHCILRTLELEQKKQTEEYGAVFKDVPTVGFSTYGESYIGHINQTSTILILK